MDGIDQMLDDSSGVGEIQQGGASSTEDFWMFFSFAMILLVFVLMNYVNYLNSLVVKVERELASQQETIEESAAEDGQPEVQELHVVVELTEDTGSPVYAFGDGETKQLLTTAEMTDRLNRDLAAVDQERPVNVFVHAPGPALYKWVFDATYAATEAAELLGLSQFDVHLVYEESP